MNDFSDDFKLESSRWYSLMKLGIASRGARACAEDITKWAPNLSKFDYEAAAGKELASTEMALTEALLAVQVSRASYERVTAEREASKVAAE
jgi:hypothetical protein